MEKLVSTDANYKWGKSGSSGAPLFEKCEAKVPRWTPMVDKTWYKVHSIRWPAVQQNEMECTLGCPSSWAEAMQPVLFSFITFYYSPPVPMGIGALREHCAGFEMIGYCLNECSGSFVMIQYLLILFPHTNAGDNSSEDRLQCRISLLVWILMDPNYDLYFNYYTSTVEVVMKEPPTLKRGAHTEHEALCSNNLKCTDVCSQLALSHFCSACLNVSYILCNVCVCVCAHNIKNGSYSMNWN